MMKTARASQLTIPRAMEMATASTERQEHIEDTGMGMGKNGKGEGTDGAGKAK